MKIGPFNITIAKRGHKAAVADRLTGSFSANHVDIGRYLKTDLRSLQNHVVGLEMEDGYTVEFLQQVSANVVGPQGIQFRPRCRKVDGRKPGGMADDIDVAACEKLARAWEKFGEKKNFSTDQRWTRRRFEQQAVRQCARLGGHLIRLHPGYPDNDFRFAVKAINIRNLDPRMTDARQNIDQGIEFDDWDRRVAYHVNVRQPRGRQFFSEISAKKERVPSDRMLHLFIADDFDQPQGKPWLTASIRRLKQLGLLEEAELVASIEHANNSKVIEQTEFTEYSGETDEAGNLREKSEPGQTLILEKGMTAKMLQATHPNAVFPDARKAFLRGICAGIFVNYNTLAKDLEGVSYSSIRQGTLSERELWKVVQCWFIDDFEVPLFEKWLRQAILVGELDFSLEDIPRLSHVEFSGRRWDWVDPLKDIMASEREVALSVNSRSRIAASRGRDQKLIAAENAEEESDLIAKGLLLPVGERGARGGGTETELFANQTLIDES